MACYHPLKGFPVGTTKNGKVDYKVVGYDAECVIIKAGGDVDVLSFVPRASRFGERIVTDFIPIPCGRCIGCRLGRSRDWATRCALEAKSHDSSYFITCTYSESDLPYNMFIDSDGVIGYKSTLVKSDLQKFIKRLRYHYALKYDNDLRYYACGEYGTKTARPHYHAIIFGLKLDDLVPYKHTGLGYQLYTSEWLNNIWRKGYVIVGGVSFESCAYVARYVCKKQYGESAAIYDKYNFEPEFNVMSLKPAIGREFFDSNYEDIYQHDEIILPEGKISRPPRYFDKLMDSIDSDMLAGLKETRLDVAEQLNKFKLSATSNSYQEMLRAEEINKENSVKKLARPVE